MMSDVGRRTSDAEADNPTPDTEGVRRQTSDVRPLVLFGGTFDPVHVAHIRVAQAVSRALGHCPVHLLPNAVPPHRPQPVASAAQRLAMLELACADYPELVVDDRELRQAGASYTLLTLQDYRSRIGERPLVFLIGEDSLAGLHDWHRWREFPALCHLAVVARPGAPGPQAQVLAAFPQADADTLCNTAAGHRLMLSRPRLDLSATGVREALRRDGHCRALPASVMAYVREQHLYR
jgi:nicotinate-nucleotide adenylyltransferase